LSPAFPPFRQGTCGTAPVGGPVGKRSLTIPSGRGTGSPEIERHPPELKRLLPPVRRVVAVAAGDRIGFRPQLAGEDQCGILGRTGAPAAETVVPPRAEEIDPGTVMR